MVETYKGPEQAGSSSATNPKPGQMAQDMGNQAFAAGRDIKDQAISAGRDLKDKARNLAEASVEAIKDQASDLTDAAKGFASQAGEKIKQAANDQKGAGAEYVGNLADSMRRAAREFENDLPIAATYIRKAASQVESVSDTVREGDFGDLLRSAQSFARRQPTAFLGLSVLAGFGVIRFLKSSASTNGEAGMSSSDSMSNYRGSAGYKPPSGSNNPRYGSQSDNRGYGATAGSNTQRYSSTPGAENRATSPTSGSDNRGYRNEFTK